MKFKRLMAVLLSMSMVVGMMPALVFAKEIDNAQVVKVSAEDSETKEEETQKPEEEKKPEKEEEKKPASDSGKKTESEDKKTDSKDDKKTESEGDKKPESEAEDKQEPKEEEKPSTDDGKKTETEGESKSEPEGEEKPESDGEKKAEPESEPETKSEPEGEKKTESEDEAKPEQGDEKAPESDEKEEPKDEPKDLEEVIVKLPPIVWKDEKASDNDEQFKTFIENKLYDKKPSFRKSGTAGSRLTGLNKVIYDALAPKIKKVAEGEISNTVFEVELPEGSYSTDYYNADQLGLPYIRNDNGSFHEDLLDKLFEKNGIDTSRINSALLADFPSELYWFDKTIGVYYNSKVGFPKINNIINYTEISFKPPLTISFAVAKSYSANPTSTEPVYETNLSGQIARVNLAKTNAQAVVNRATSKSDYEKLVYYRDQICSFVVYDDDAADDSTNTPYGDPWQLISVFDDDSSTNVVCEGYSKAYKYLCDLTTFSKNIECYTVTGVLTTPSVTGGHMWNHVKMGNGKYYLVDVTNCDDGTTGYPDKLFMVGYTTCSLGNWYRFDFKTTTGRSTYANYEYYDYTKNTYSDELKLSDSNYNAVQASGSCGTNMTWTFDGATETLTISGEGYMDNWGNANPPWDEYKGSIKKVVIEEGVTSTGHYAFYGYTKLTNITIPYSMRIIGDGTLGGCTGLTDVYYCGTSDDWTLITRGSGMPCLDTAAFHFYLSVTVSPTTNGTASVDKTRAKKGDEITVSVNPAVGYALDEIKVNGTKITGYTFDMPDENVTVVVTFIRNMFTLTFKDGQRVISTTNLTRGSKITKPADPVKDGYRFIGWYEDAEFEHSFVFGSGIESDTTIYANFIQEYTVSVTSGTADMTKAIAGETVTVTADTAPSGYVFDKWEAVPATVTFADPNSVTTTFNMPEGNVSIKATYVRVYSITMKLGTADKENALAGETVTITAADAPSGFIFDKWEAVTGTVIFADQYSATTTFIMPEGNVSIVARYMVNSGSCGDDLAWNIDEGGKLTISGTGAMQSWNSASDVPWVTIKDRIKVVVISDEVTAIEKNAFKGCTNLTSITIPGSVTSIGDSAFEGCTSLTVVTYGGTKEKWNSDVSIGSNNDALNNASIQYQKADNTFKVKGKTATVKYKKLKKKAQTLSVFKVLTFTNRGQGTLTYAKVSGSSKISINKTTGKITIKKKGLKKKKTYSVKIKVMAAGNDDYNASTWKTVTFKIKVK